MLKRADISATLRRATGKLYTPRNGNVTDRFAPENVLSHGHRNPRRGLRGTHGPPKTRYNARYRLRGIEVLILTQLIAPVIDLL